MGRYYDRLLFDPPVEVLLDPLDPFDDPLEAALEDPPLDLLPVPLRLPRVVLLRRRPSRPPTSCARAPVLLQALKETFRVSRLR